MCCSSEQQLASEIHVFPTSLTAVFLTNLVTPSLPFWVEHKNRGH